MFWLWLRAHPIRMVPIAYLLMWMVGTTVLLIPAATAPGRNTGFWEAGFTAMSALCITGLANVDTATHWSHLGQSIIIGLIQLGGFGIMTLTSVILFALGRRVNHASAQVAQLETRSRMQGIRRIPAWILGVTVIAEGSVAAVLTLRHLTLGKPLHSALWHGGFHAVSAFNNAGFALTSDNLVGFNDDAWIMVPLCLAIVVGGIGFPVLRELVSRVFHPRPGRFFSVHLRITLIGTALLLLGGFLTFLLFEWNNPGTLGGKSLDGKLLGCLGGAVFPRTAGFNSIDYGQANGATIAINYALMLIGGGSAGTAGGLKIGTVAILLLAVATEVSGERETVFAHRTISAKATRQALSVTVVALLAIAVAVVILTGVDRTPLDAAIFESVSAFGTVGLSMNLTPTLCPASWAALMGLMFLGRVGPIAIAISLALHIHPRRYEFPQEDPLVG